MVTVQEEVFTPLGKGKVVHKLPDGTFVVEFPHGGGQIFRADELFRICARKRSTESTRYDQEVSN